MDSVADTVERIDLDIDGMTCSGCEARLEKSLNKAPGITSATVSLALERASLQFDPLATTLEDLTQEIAKTGFHVRTTERKFVVEGLSSEESVDQIRSLLLSVPGVLDVDVEKDSQFRVSYVNNVVEPSILAKHVASSGFALEEEVDDDSEHSRSSSVERRNIFVASALTLPLVLQMIAQFLGWERIHLMPAAEVVLATPVQLWFGLRFYKGAWAAVRGGGANMDVLVVLGTTAAYVYSWYLMISLGEAAQGELYFEASAVIICLVLWGKYLESGARKRTSAAIHELLELRPTTARVQIEAEEFEELPVSQVKLGSVVRCLPGERIAVDGDVIHGVASVDESLVTGESVPVVRREGDRVLEGSFNLDGVLDIRATHLGEDSTLSKIARLVEQAQIGKANIQRLVDKVSGIFVPIVIAIALGTIGVWFLLGAEPGVAIVNAVAVLVIACPCALGLATPSAVITGMGVAARAGILFRDIEAMEIGYRVDQVVFDKTGTLTEGKPEITDFEVTSSEDPQNSDNLYRLAASVQVPSEHPIAEAFARRADSREISLAPVQDFHSFVAEGVSGIVEGIHCLVGNEKLMERFGLQPELSSDIDSSGSNCIWFACDGRIAARINFEDKLRDEAPAAVTLLTDARVDVHVLSGDSQQATEGIARQLGVTSYSSRMTPESKAQQIRDLEIPGRSVAMVGDGINDAPALAEAHLGIAMGTGTDVAIEVARITLMHPDPRLVHAALNVSKRTFRKIQQNLFWAFIYNLVMIPLACQGLLSPTIAGAAMAFSSLSVVANSLLLRRWTPKF